MGIYLAVDTSNYTTSCAVYDSVSGKAVSKRKLLPVRSGEKGIRQSDAVFHHTAALPSVIADLKDEFGGEKLSITAAGASDKPSNIENSYMPCFSVGSSFIKSLCAVNGIGSYFNSHQHGHIAAALWSADRLDLLGGQFVAFHVSGGTTEAVLCAPDKNSVFNCSRLLYSTDLKAGQAIDRIGLMLGGSFPAGVFVDKLSLQSDKSFKIKPSVKDGCPSLSGLQNKCEKMFSENSEPCDIAKYCIEYISLSLSAMTDKIRDVFPHLPIVYSGGVLSNTIIRKNLSQYSDTVFGAAEFSSDNAVGTAVLTALKDELNK